MEKFSTQFFLSDLKLLRLIEKLFILIYVLIDWFCNQFSFFWQNFSRAKAIKELNQLRYCDWLTSHPRSFPSVYFHPRNYMCSPCNLFNSNFFLHLHFPALIASSSCAVRKTLCWFNLHHAIMQTHTEIPSIIRNWRDLTPCPCFAYVRPEGIVQRSVFSSLLLMENQVKWLVTQN